MAERTIEVGDRQGRGNPPAFYTKGHRVNEVTPDARTRVPTYSKAYALIAALGAVAFAILCLVVIAVTRPPNY
jgi:hypothetical protein